MDFIGKRKSGKILDMFRRMFFLLFLLAGCLSVQNCQAFVTWGLCDRYSWIDGFTGHPDQPLLLNRQSQPKPVYQTVREELVSPRRRAR